MNKAGRPFGTFKHAHPCRVGGKLTKTYQAWQGMLARCYGNHPSSKYYKGRIEVCEQWRSKDGYNQFVLDVGVAPVGLWLERKDNSKGYYPGNVIWTTPKEQANNRRQGGEKNAQPMSLASLAKVFGVPYPRVYQRVRIHGWTIADALTHRPL